jgi:hypothetical protein
VNAAVIWLDSMRANLKVRCFVALLLVTSIGAVLQSRLSHVTSAFSYEIEKAESPLHHGTLRRIGEEFPAIAHSKRSVSVDSVIQKSDSSILDYCLFRRTIECRYNYNVMYLRRELAHSRIPHETRIDEHYVDIPSQHKTQQTVRVSASPFGYNIAK